MAAELTIKYLTDSIEGNSLSTTVAVPGHGWVEYCNQRGQLFYADAVSEEFYKKCHQQAIEIITTCTLEKNKKNIGFINHLSNVLVNDEFVFPIFGVVPIGGDEPSITAGVTRMIANIMNGRTSREFKIVVYVPNGQTITQLKNAKPLTSTAEFEKIYNLADIDYEIVMSDSPNNDLSEFRFDRSVIRHSIFDKQDQTLPHAELGSGILDFWPRHIKKDKIQLSIRCTPEVEKLIQPSDMFNWDVVHEKADDWVWSYGKILGAYRKTELPLSFAEPQIHLWLYDVTELVYLELLLPWMTGHYSCCHTKNKKALFFDTSRDVTSMNIIGNWVK
jgi:hypothetical protein